MDPRKVIEAFKEKYDAMTREEKINYLKKMGLFFELINKNEKIEEKGKTR